MVLRTYVVSHDTSVQVRFVLVVSLVREESYPAKSLYIRKGFVDRKCIVTGRREIVAPYNVMVAFKEPNRAVLKVQRSKDCNLQANRTPAPTIRQ